MSKWRELGVLLPCVSDNAIEAVDEFAFLEGEFPICGYVISTCLFHGDDGSSDLKK
jgi:hypothetical protein